MKISDALVVCFACVTKSWHLISGRVFVGLRRQNLWHKLRNTRSEFFFVYHVETSNQVGVCFLADLDVLNHLVNM